MPKHSRAASSLSSLDAEDNQIERIAGVHLDGNQYYRLGWDIQHFSSQEINPIILKMFLEGRFRRDGYGLSLIGHAMYQLWSPESLTQVKYNHSKYLSLGTDFSIDRHRLLQRCFSRRGQYVPGYQLWGLEAEPTLEIAERGSGTVWSHKYQCITGRRKRSLQNILLHEQT